MYTPQELHTLHRIQGRRRVRRWMLSVQVGLVVFFCDQILKTWCAKRVPLGERDGILGQSALALVYFPETDLPASWISIAFWLALVGFALIRDKKSNLTETIAFTFALAGSFSELVSRFVWNSPVRTFSLLLPFGRHVVFNLAELALWVAVLGLWTCLLRKDETFRVSQRYELPS